MNRASRTVGHTKSLYISVIEVLEGKENETGGEMYLKK